MRVLLILFATLLAPGCLIVPKTVRADRTLSTSWTEPAPGSTGKGVLRAVARSEGNTMHVAVTEGGKCVHRQVLLVETTKRTEATLAVAGHDPLAVIFSVVTLPISAIVTGIIVANSPDETTRSRKLGNLTERVDCPGPGGGPAVAFDQVVLSLPNGARLAERTDEAGIAHFDLPSGEPSAGLATLLVGAIGPRSLRMTYGDAAERTFGEQRVGLSGMACRPVEGMRKTFACELGSACREGRCVPDSGVRPLDPAVGPAEPDRRPAEERLPAPRLDVRPDERDERDEPFPSSMVGRSVHHEPR